MADINYPALVEATIFHRRQDKSTFFAMVPAAVWPDFLFRSVAKAADHLRVLVEGSGFGKERVIAALVIAVSAVEDDAEALWLS